MDISTTTPIRIPFRVLTSLLITYLPSAPTLQVSSWRIFTTVVETEKGKCLISRVQYWSRVGRKGRVGW